MSSAVNGSVNKYDNREFRIRLHDAKWYEYPNMFIVNPLPI